MADSSQDFATIIGADASFKGDLQFESAAKVLGKFEGSINSKGKVHIADGCTCRATVSAKEIAVEGRVDGNIEAGDRIEIRPTGVVAGDIVATRMIMAEGASINGHCQIGPNSKTGTTTEPKPAATAKPNQPGQQQAQTKQAAATAK